MSRRAGAPVTEVLVVTGEPPWPPHHGGRIRAARLVEELGKHLAVCVVAPLEDAPPTDLAVEVLPPGGAVPRLTPLRTPGPALGRALLGPERAGVLDAVMTRRRPGVVLFTHSYLAAAAPQFGVPMVVDFQDLEVRRMASLAPRGPLRSRVAHGVEAVKARRWEPAVARRCAVVTAAAADDVQRLARWGADALLVPHGADHFDVSPSPADGPVTVVASFRYEPNRDALEWVLGEVWPRLHRADAGMRLRVAGRQADQAVEGRVLDGKIEVVSDPVSVDRYYEEASVVLVPVRTGGGPQLKVTEALTRGRVVVANSYSARSVPPSASGGVMVADGPEAFAAATLRLWHDVAGRRAHERAIAASPPLPTWEEACAPLVHRLERLVKAG